MMGLNILFTWTHIIFAHYRGFKFVMHLFFNVDEMSSSFNGNKKCYLTLQWSLSNVMDTPDATYIIEIFSNYDRDYEIIWIN